MIDTIKIYTEINKNLYNFILYKQNVSTKFNASTGELFYEVCSEDLKGSYDSNIHCSVGRGNKYGFVDSYYIEIECSVHKVLRGQNAYNGFYNLTYCAMQLVLLIEKYYDVILPDIEFWYCCRVDIAKNFDLDTQEKVQTYINSLKLLSFPRRKKQIYPESIYFPGQVTTLKVYNKLLEFEKHDKKRLSNFGTFDLLDHMCKIKGYVRFECEIKSRKLKNIYLKNNIKVIDVLYEDLEKVWCDEFMKLLKFDVNDKDNKILKKVRTKEDVYKRLETIYPDSLRKVNLLYNFFITLINDGYDSVRLRTSKSTFYRNISELKQCGIDFSQSSFDDVLSIDESKIINFDPFIFKEVI